MRRHELLDKLIKKVQQRYRGIMKSKIKLPVFTISYFIISISIKTILIILNAGQRDLSLIYYLSTLLMFSQDLIASAFIFLILDLPWDLLSENKKKIITIITKSLTGILFFVFTLYSVINIKIYSLLGTFLNSWLFAQVNQISSFGKGIASEIDILTIVLIPIAGAITTISIFLKNRNMKLISPKISGIIAGILILYCIAAPFLLKVTLPKSNLYSIEKNPALEFIGSLFKDSQSDTEDSSKEIFIGIKKLEAAEMDSQNKKQKKQKKQAASGVQTSAATEENVETPTEESEGLSFQSVINDNKDAQRIILPGNYRNISKGMNVIFFKFESTALQYLGLYNRSFSRYTPNMNKLAESSVFLQNHYAVEPASMKALHSVLSGKYSGLTRNWGDFIKDTDHIKTMPEILRKNGYDTIFLTSTDSKIYNLRYYIDNRFSKKYDKTDISKMNLSYKNVGIGYDDRVLVHLFEEYLKKSPGKFFAFFTPTFPHHPYMVPSEEFIVSGSEKSFGKYKNSLFYSDYIIGELIKLLEKYNKREKTLFVLFADHGEAFYQHPGNYLHSIYLYQENINTFCFLSNPQLFKNQKYKSVTSHVDITPTVLDILGIKSTENFDGVSLISQHPERLAYFYTTFSKSYFGIKDDKWKYIINLDYQSEELFDLTADPSEKNNQVKLYPKIAAQFKKRILALRKYID